MKIMSFGNQTTTELIHQAENIGLLSMPQTAKCPFCSSLFPKEYARCPKCMMEHLFDIQIDFEF